MMRSLGSFCFFSVLFLAVACRGDHEPQTLPDVEAVVGERGSRPGRFISPRSVAYDEDRGFLCVVDRSGRIQRFQESKETDAETDAETDGDSLLGKKWDVETVWYLPEFELGQPTGIHFNRDGHLLVADTHYQRIHLYDVITGELIHTWGRKGTGDGEFSQVRAVIQDAQGNYYAGDYNPGPVRDRVHKFDRDGNHLFSFGRNGNAPGEFRRVQGMAMAVSESDGETLLVVDSCNHRIQRFSLQGEFLATWGKLGSGPGEFKFPYGVSVQKRRDGQTGDIFIVEWGNNRVQRFDSEGRFLASWGRAGRGVGELATPWDVTVDSTGRAYIADFGNDRVQVFRIPKFLVRHVREFQGGRP